jgi:hypothetical protein
MNQKNRSQWIAEMFIGVLSQLVKFFDEEVDIIHTLNLIFMMI